MEFKIVGMFFLGPLPMPRQKGKKGKKNLESWELICIEAHRSEEPVET